MKKTTASPPSNLASLRAFFPARPREFFSRLIPVSRERWRLREISTSLLASAWPTRLSERRHSSRQNSGWTGQDQHPRRLRHVLHGDRGADGRNSGRRTLPLEVTYSSPAPPLFATPFITASTGQIQAQPFPVALVTQKASSSNPNPNVNWSQYEPISGIPGYSATNRIPYVEQYMLSIQRQLGANTVFSASYVGTQAHRLLVMVEANPGDPALCLSLSQPSARRARLRHLRPFRREQRIHDRVGPGDQRNPRPAGSELRQRHQSVDDRQIELQRSRTQPAPHQRTPRIVRRIHLQQVDGRIFKSWRRSQSDQSRPQLRAVVFRHHRTTSLSATTTKFHSKALFHASNRWTEGWELSGITHFSSGLPVTLINYGDNSLLGAEPNGINNYGVDEPDYSGGPLDLNHNPRNGRPYFNPSQFSQNALGTPGTAKRRFFYGPGMNNYDMALAQECASD